MSIDYWYLVTTKFVKIYENLPLKCLFYVEKYNCLRTIKLKFESEKVKSSSLLQISLIKYVQINLIYNLKKELVEKRGLKNSEYAAGWRFFIRYWMVIYWSKKKFTHTDIKEWEAALGEEK